MILHVMNLFMCTQKPLELEMPQGPEGMVLDCIAMLLALCTAGLSDTYLVDICVHLSKAAVTLCGRALQCSLLLCVTPQTYQVGPRTPSLRCHTEVSR